jgi:hypothetical protein
MSEYEAPRVTHQATLPKVEYRVVDDAELLRLGLREKSRWSSDHYWAVVRYEDDAAKEVIGEDGGEPEDQLLVRDWDWVPKALDEAYQLGMKNGLLAVLREVDDFAKA